MNKTLTKTTDIENKEVQSESASEGIAFPTRAKLHIKDKMTYTTVINDDNNNSSYNTISI